MDHAHFFISALYLNSICVTAELPRMSLSNGSDVHVANDIDRFVLGELELDQPYVFATEKGNFRTFTVPDNINKLTSIDHCALGKEMIRAFRTDGLFQIEIGDDLVNLTNEAISESKSFFHNTSLVDKRKLVDDLSYSGYIGSGEEMTDGKADGSEIFTITPDVALNDSRIVNKWPCHGPVPWPCESYKRVMTNYMWEMGKIGDILLKLIALGLNLNIDTFYNYAQNGWHHMRVLRFPSQDKVSSNINRGIGAHTDYGLLVIATQDDVGGLSIRPPVCGEQRLNAWMDGNTMAGVYENDDPWTFVDPVAGTLTVFPGDMFQLLTNGYLLSTPHKVSLNATRERFALAYFHEPSFEKKLETVPMFQSNGIHHSIEYGTHFTNMFVRGLPDRSVSKKLIASNYKRVLKDIFEEST